MLVAIFLLALLTLSLAIAVPRITKEIQRERELEAMHRGKQYTRAIQLYYRKFHRYPPNIDALVNTNDIRFLRKRYIDPISRKDDWRPIFFGQNKLPTAIGFFGMTLSGLPIAPIGSDANGTTGAAGGSSASSGLSGSSGAFGSSSGLSGSSGAFGSNGGLSGSSGGFGSSSGLSGSSGGFGSSGGLSSSSSSDTQSFGNTALIGVTIPNEKHSMLVYKRQQQYDMWEFTYDPIVDSPTMPGGGAGGLGGASAAPSSGGLGGLAPSPGGIGGFAPSPSGTTPNSPFGTNSNQPSQSPQQ